MHVLVHVFAQAQGVGAGNGGGIPWGDILKIGVTPVAVVLLLISRMFRIGPDVDNQITKLETLWGDRVQAEKDRADRAEKLLEEEQERGRRLRDTAEDKFLPALDSSRNAMEKMLDFVMRGPPNWGGQQPPRG